MVKIAIEEINKDAIDKLMNELDEAGDLEDTEKYALKQLLTANDRDIAFKTDLEAPQINAIAKILTVHQIIQAQAKFIEDEEKGKEMMSKIAPALSETMMRLLVSKKRGGRKEFVDAFKGGMSGMKDDANFKKFVGGI